jgi:hypothetical protein
MAQTSTRRIMQRFLYFLFLSACLCLLEFLSVSEINLTHTLPRSENFTKSVFSISNFSQPESHIMSSNLVDYILSHSYNNWTKEKSTLDDFHAPWKLNKIIQVKNRTIYTNTNTTYHHRTVGNFNHKNKRTILASEGSAIGDILRKLEISIPAILATQIPDFLHIYATYHNKTFDILIHKQKSLLYVAGSTAIGVIFHKLEILTLKFWPFQIVDLLTQIRIDLSIHRLIQLSETSSNRNPRGDCICSFITAFWTTFQKCPKSSISNEYVYRMVDGRSNVRCSCTARRGNVSICLQSTRNTSAHGPSSTRTLRLDADRTMACCLQVWTMASYAALSHYGFTTSSDARRHQLFRVRTLPDLGCQHARSAVIYVRSLQISGHIELSFVHNISLHTPKTLLPSHDHTLASVSVSVSASVYVVSVVSVSEYEKIFFIHYVKNPLQNFFHAYVCPDYKWSDTTYTLRPQHHPSHVFAALRQRLLQMPDPYALPDPMDFWSGPA